MDVAEIEVLDPPRRITTRNLMEPGLTTTYLLTALANPLRRSLLENLARHSPRTATQLAHEYPITRQGLLKHPHVLEKARLVTVHQEGREKRFTLTPEPLSEMDHWLKDIGDVWDARLLRLKQFVEGGKGE